MTTSPRGTLRTALTLVVSMFISQSSAFMYTMRSQVPLTYINIHMLPGNHHNHDDHATSRASPFRINHQAKLSNDNGDELPDSEISGGVDAEKNDLIESSSNNPFDRINSILDTPILDANDRTNQGPISEALKSFVRDDPQLAQITFSGFVVVTFLVGLRLFNAVRYGGF